MVVYIFVLLQMLVSGGVDSSVCAALLHRALKPDQVIALHIDNGFMRKNESEHVVENLRELGVPIKSKYVFIIIALKSDYFVYDLKSLQ